MTRKRNQHRNKLLNYANGYRGAVPSQSDGNYRSLVHVDSSHAYRYDLHIQSKLARTNKPSDTWYPFDNHEYDHKPTDKTVSKTEHETLSRMRVHEYKLPTMRKHRHDYPNWKPSAKMVDISAKPKVKPTIPTATEIALSELKTYQHLISIDIL